MPASQFAFTETVIGGKKYEYYVTAFNSLGGESKRSISFKVTPIKVPSGMVAPTRVTHDLNSVTLQWTAPPNNGKSEVLRYLLYAKADYEANYKLAFTGLALSYRVQLLQPGFFHVFKVRSENAAGLSALSPASLQI